MEVWGERIPGRRNRAGEGRVMFKAHRAVVAGRHGGPRSSRLSLETWVLAPREKGNGKRFEQRGDMISFRFKALPCVLCGESTVLKYGRAIWVRECLKPAPGSLHIRGGPCWPRGGVPARSRLCTSHTRTLSCPPEMGSGASWPHNTPFIRAGNPGGTWEPTKGPCVDKGSAGRGLSLRCSWTGSR